MCDIRSRPILKTLPDVAGTRADVVALITGAPLFWEIQDGDACRCVDCARNARKVKQHDQRGRRRR